MARKNRFIADLDVYENCVDAERIGIVPLAVGFLQHGQLFETGAVNDKFMQKLLPFCAPDTRVFSLPRAMACPLCRQRVEMAIGEQMVRLGSAEIRIIGEQEIFAAPDLLPHYIEAHDYRPPIEFVEAVLHGVGVNSAEYRALIKALR
ncbi:MAG TPA: hypothetical protein ENJ56_02855 [Anaerolineae bacterium]|nr:hypothetical protein [Anaerolineae bacterium]